MVGKFSGSALTKTLLQLHTGREEERALDRHQQQHQHGNVETQSVANSEFQEGDDPFLPIRRLANSSLLTHKQTLAVLAAVEEIIDETTRRRSPASYFAALMTFLEQHRSFPTSADPAAPTPEDAKDPMNHSDHENGDGEEDGDETNGEYYVKGKKSKKQQNKWRKGKGSHSAAAAGLAATKTDQSVVPHGSHGDQGAQEDLTTAVFQLLAIIFPRLSQAVLRTKFADISRIITNILETHFEQPTLVRHVRPFLPSPIPLLPSSSPPLFSQAIDCLCVALGAQDATTWALPITHSIFRKVTAVSLDPRPKVRKVAQDGVTSLLQNPRSATPAAEVVGALCVHTSRNLDLGDTQRSTHFVHLLRDFMPHLSAQHCEDLVHQLIRIATSNQAFATLAVFQALGAFFARVHGKLQPHILAQLLEEFQSVKPDPNDTQLVIAWLKMEAAGYKSLTKFALLRSPFLHPRNSCS